MRDTGKETRGDELLARVLAGDEWASGISSDLLIEFWHGYPIRNLVPLLHSKDERVVESGAWIASELASRARPILEDLVPLFEHPAVRVRYYCVETVLTASTGEDGEVVGRAIARIADDERPVRRMTFQLMTRADRSPLLAGISYVSDHTIAGLLKWALQVESESPEDDEEITERLHRSDERERLFAVIAAARVYTRNPHPLQLAASLGESDAQTFAASELAYLSKSQEQSQRRKERAERSDG